MTLLPLPSIIDFVAVALHYLSKLTDMIEIAVNFKMTIINISASAVFMRAVGIGYSDTVAVGNTEQLFIMRIDKADTASCAFEVMVKPVLAVTIAVEIIFALMGIEPHKVGVILCIHSHAVISACTVTLAKLQDALCIITKTAQGLTVGKKLSVLSERIDYIIKFAFEFGRFQILAKIIPS